MEMEGKDWGEPPGVSAPAVACGVGVAPGCELDGVGEAVGVGVAAREARVGVRVGFAARGVLAARVGDGLAAVALAGT